MLHGLVKKDKIRPTFDDVDPLSERELEVLRLICQELTTTEIAGKLFLSPRTVEGHRNNILLKTGARNTAGLVVYAMSKGIFRP
jgi:DNA-binding CsgD family transcriptional regulator